MLRRLRAFVFPVLLLAALEWWARTVGKGSDALAPATAAARSFAQALTDGSLVGATAFTLGSAAAGLALASVLGIALGTVLQFPHDIRADGALSGLLREMRC